MEGDDRQCQRFCLNICETEGDLDKIPGECCNDDEIHVKGLSEQDIPSIHVLNVVNCLFPEIFKFTISDNAILVYVAPLSGIAKGSDRFLAAIPLSLGSLFQMFLPIFTFKGNTHLTSLSGHFFFAYYSCSTCRA